jgi:uncharacterized protein (DUF2267 family)
MPQHADPFESSLQAARRWLAHIADRVGTEDRGFAYQLTRAWLHTVRDRLAVNAAVHLSAQLPELLRGIYFENWTPSHVPVGHHNDAFIEQFTAESGVAASQVPVFAGLLTAAFDELFSEGQLDHAFATLPRHLVELLSGNPRPDAVAR